MGEKVITAVSEPTDCVLSLLIVENKGMESLPLLMNLKDPNSQVTRSCFPHPIFEQKVPDLNKSKMFFTSDARDGF